MWSLRPATKSSPCSPQLEKAHMQQRRPNAAKKKKEASHKRPHIVWFHWYEMSRIGKSIETRRRPSFLVPRAGGDGRSQGWWLKGMEFLWGGDENVLELIVVMVAQLCEYTQSCWICILLVGELYSMCEFYLNKAIVKMGKNNIYLTQVQGGLKVIMYVNHPACIGAPELVAMVIKTPLLGQQQWKSQGLVRDIFFLFLFCC